MNNLNHILLVGDTETLRSDSPILDYSLHLARQHGAKLTVLDVIEPLSSPTRLLASLAIPVDKIQQFSVQERGKELAALVALYRNQGLGIDYAVGEGKAFVEIIRYVLKARCDLVIKVAQSAGSHLFGSTDTSLLRKCPCPVWLVNDNQTPRTARILAAVDIDKPDQDFGINKTIVEYAASLAARGSGELHVVQCWSVPKETSYRFGLGRMSTDDMQRVNQLSELSYRNWIEELLAPYEDKLRGRIHLHLRKGDPKLGIPYVAEKKAVDLIVMGSIHRSGVAGMFIGTTAESVFCQAKTSVFAIKPDNFETPVRLPEHLGDEQAAA